MLWILLELLATIVALCASEPAVSNAGERSAGAPGTLVCTSDDPKPEDVRIGNDPKKRYLLHAPPKESKEASSGWRVLIVMPGGDGSAEFAPFVGNIRAKALGEGWVVAQIVAPMWDDEQVQSNVWPTEKNPYKTMKLSTEKLFDAVLEDLGKRKRIDPKSIFTLSWSSSGPAAYALSLQPKTKIAGSFIAMSEFKPDLLPPLKNAAGRSYYLYHSQQDTIVPIRVAETARDELIKNGASVEFVEYSGGNGWHGEVFDDIRRGVAWLQEKTAKPVKSKSDK
jgi:predicted esterase